MHQKNLESGSCIVRYHIVLNYLYSGIIYHQRDVNQLSINNIIAGSLTTYISGDCIPAIVDCSYYR